MESNDQYPNDTTIMDKPRGIYALTNNFESGLRAIKEVAKNAGLTQLSDSSLLDEVDSGALLDQKPEGPYNSYLLLESSGQFDIPKGLRKRQLSGSNAIFPSMLTIYHHKAISKYNGYANGKFRMYIRDCANMDQRSVIYLSLKAITDTKNVWPFMLYYYDDVSHLKCVTFIDVTDKESEAKVKSTGWFKTSVIVHMNVDLEEFAGHNVAFLVVRQGRLKLEV